MVQTTDPLWRKPSSALAEAVEPQAVLGLSELRLIVLLLAPLVVFRIWVAGNMDFESDETYYWLWSRHMALSFYDHPPMVAYLIRLGTWLLGDTALGLRCMSIAAILIASGLIYLMALSLFNDRRVAWLSLLWFNATPHTAFFSVIMFPDTPALMFWVLCCYALAQLWRSGRPFWWYVAGVTLGLTMLSKYTGAFLIPGVGAWLLLSADMRPWLRRREPYLGALIALALFSPVILWNAQHGWGSFSLQFGRVLDSTPDSGLANAAAFLGVQAAFVSPVIFLFALAGLAVAFYRGLVLDESNWLLLALTSGPTLLFFLFHALSAKVLPQWPSAAYATAILAAVAAFARQAEDPQERPWLRRGFIAAPWIGLVMTVGMYLQMTMAPAPLAAAQDPLNKFSGWAELARDTREAITAQHAGYIATSEYGTNSILAFYLPRDVVIFQASEAMRYTNLPPIDQSLLRRSAGLYLTSAKEDEVERLRPHYESVVLVATIERARRSDPFETFRLYRLSGYRGGLPY
jgi:4-amino-4-deoxy-L-arabinose transferase-like glycosyltransferase